MQFHLQSDFSPTGDQPQAIKKLTDGLNAGLKHQVLLGVTGSGKTFTMANVIEKVQKPTLVISHNKTLAAQLFQEYRDFFPQNGVEYFVSYYDYYQPEAYIPQSDTYIEKDAAINEDIDKLRLSASTSLMTRVDVIVVASVSCIYNLGSPVEYKRLSFRLVEGMPLRREDLLTRLVQLFYTRNDIEFKPSIFRVKGETVDIWPAYEDFALRLEIHNNVLQKIKPINPTTGKVISSSFGAGARTCLNPDSAIGGEVEFRSAEHKTQEITPDYTLYPAKHYITNQKTRAEALGDIQEDLNKRTQQLREEGKQLEAYRLEQKTNYDLELIEEIGYTKGIENYSRYFDGRKPGEPPYTLMDFFPDDYLIIIDESHITIPQIRGMYNGDAARKQNLIDYGFRLPSALDNRPLKLSEFLDKANQIIYTSATPGDWEIERAEKASGSHMKHLPVRQAGLPVRQAGRMFNVSRGGVIEQLIRPTGLLDPEITVRSTGGQVNNLVDEILKRVKKGQRTLVTTLTKRMAEDLADYLREQDVKVTYLHADIDTLDRSEILADLRKGKYDVVVGINLLREGLDLPEVSLVAILDADKEGFLRSETSLIQTMGRAARHVEGEVIMYADTITGSMQRAIDEVNRRRKIQQEYNEKHGIEPKSIQKPFRKELIARGTKDKKSSPEFNLSEYLNKSPKTPQTPKDLSTALKKLKKEMQLAAEELNFEKAAILRDQIDTLRN